MLCAMKKSIPIAPFGAGETSACDGAEAFALMVLGNSMEPEFREGEVVIIEPSGLAVDGSYVLAYIDDEWIFRELKKTDAGWRLAPLNPAYAARDIDDLSPVRGVIIQKSVPGRRKLAKRYVE